ncbi:MAG: ssk1 response regulator receiver [Pycnora praestabilis]|nr:MAG: ssk1 response regulator receiver [Pycnora praestabilis]
MHTESAKRSGKGSATETLELSDLPHKDNFTTGTATEKNPRVTLEEPTPVQHAVQSERFSGVEDGGVELEKVEQDANGSALGGEQQQLNLQRPKESTLRRQSLLPASQARLVRTLLESENPSSSRGSDRDYFGGPPTITRNMISKKIWVKRPGASATLVSVHEEDLVDDVRDMILKKYANSLGRSFDSPDVTLRLCPRDQTQRNSRDAEQILSPDQSIGQVLDSHYPGGQSVDEALIIDVPQRRTPKPSPRTAHHMPYYEDLRPNEAGVEYFPQMPAIPSPKLQAASVPNVSGQSGSHHPHSMSVLNTGQVPALPSPSIRSARHPLHTRPKHSRTHTNSPTHPNTSTPLTSNDAASVPPIPPPLPTPPAHDSAPKVGTPPARTASPRPKSKRGKKGNDHPQLPTGLLEGAVPPINVLIVEDNVINMRILEAFMRKLKVRWQKAMDGQAAIDSWRKGGFHLVLMDIQLPIKNGLEATREIRRLERVNSIGVFSSSASSKAPEGTTQKPEEEDKLTNTVLFKSPVIIVALTASSLQSDRHEALAAGCNDFLTKPVSYVWLERKVMEWGCMQALIDFDGWRKWKDFSQSNEQEVSNIKENKGEGKKSAPKRKELRNTESMSGPASEQPPVEGQQAITAGGA